jgi:hypothetical protein
MCIGIAATLLVVEELVKLVLRRRAHSAPATSAVTATPALAH